MIANQAYSSKVQIRLKVNDHVLNVAQVGEDSLILRNPCEVPPSFGLIQITVDDHRDDYPIFLHQGISASSALVEFRDAPAPRPDKWQGLLFDDDKSVPDCPF